MHLVGIDRVTDVRALSFCPTWCVRPNGKMGTMLVKKVACSYIIRASSEENAHKLDLLIRLRLQAIENTLVSRDRGVNSEGLPLRIARWSFYRGTRMAIKAGPNRCRSYSGRSCN
jgi:hypothetical protein